MPRIPLDIVSGSYQSESRPFNAQRCINWIPVVNQSDGGALSQKMLTPFYGINSFTTSGIDPSRGGHEMAGTPYFVQGQALYSVSESGTLTNHGFIAGSNMVSTADNGLKLVIVVPGVTAYVFDSSLSTITEITDPDFIISDGVTFKDGYFVFSASDGSVFFNSALNDPLTYDALDFGTAEINPDKIVSVHTDHNELFVIGEKTIELFQNTGGPGFPFKRIPGGNIEKGSHALHGTKQFDNTFTFIGGGENEKTAIWKVTGSSSTQKISTSAIDLEIQKFTKKEINNAWSMTFSQGGNFFVSFTFESQSIDSKTFVYNATSSALSGSPVWLEAQSGVSNNSWRVKSIVKGFGEFLLSDSIDGRIGVLKDKAYTEYGETIVRTRTTAPFHNNGTSLFWGSLELTIEQGVGLTKGQGSDPIMRMSFSDNGARTFSSEFQRKMGKIGEYNKKLIWRRQNRISNNRVLKFETSEPVPAVIIKCEVNAESGTG